MRLSSTKLKYSLVLLLASLAGLAGLAAHPHMMLETDVTLVRSGDKLTGITLTWYLDIFFSAGIIQDYDKDRNGSFNAKETALLEAEAFSNLKNYGYFVLFRTAKGRFPAKTVRNFSAAQKDGMLVYTFTLPLEGLDLGDEFHLAVFDLTYFCAVDYRPQGLKLVGEGTVPVSYRLVQNKNSPIYYNPNGTADDTTLYPKWKPGLETAYPEEVEIRISRS